MKNYERDGECLKCLNDDDCIFEIGGVQKCDECYAAEIYKISNKVEELLNSLPYEFEEMAVDKITRDIELYIKEC